MKGSNFFQDILNCNKTAVVQTTLICISCFFSDGIAQRNYYSEHYWLAMNNEYFYPVFSIFSWQFYFVLNHMYPWVSISLRRIAMALFWLAFSYYSWLTLHCRRDVEGNIICTHFYKQYADWIFEKMCNNI